MERPEDMSIQHRPPGPQVDGLIAWYAAAGRPAVMAEIGSAYGESATVWLECNPALRLYCVDPWTCGSGGGVNERYGELAFKEFMEQHGSRGNVTVIRAMSVAAADLFEPGELDAVYIDAVHRYTYVRDDIAAWLPKLKPGGYIGGHDYAPRFDGCMRAVDEQFGTGTVQTFEDTSWLAQVGQ